MGLCVGHWGFTSCSRFSPRTCYCRNLAMNWVGKKPALPQGKPSGSHIYFDEGCALLIFSMKFLKTSVILLHFLCIFSFRESARVTILPWFARDFSAFETERPASQKPSWSPLGSRCVGSGDHPRSSCGESCHLKCDICPDWPDHCAAPL